MAQDLRRILWLLENRREEPSAPSSTVARSNPRPRSAARSGSWSESSVYSPESNVPTSSMRLRGGQADHLSRHLILCGSAMPCDLFHRMSVAVARRKIHPCIDSRWIAAQCLLDRAVFLHKFAPVRRAQETQAGNAVANRNLIHRTAGRTHTGIFGVRLHEDSSFADAADRVIKRMAAARQATQRTQSFPSVGWRLSLTTELNDGPS